MTLRKVVIRVAIMNLVYWGVECGVALAIGSVSLFADSVYRNSTEVFSRCHCPVMHFVLNRSYCELLNGRD